MAAGWAGVAYGVFLTLAALRSSPGGELTGQWSAQPVFKALMALLLAFAAAAHPIVRERRWLMPALVFSAAGDALLARLPTIWTAVGAVCFAGSDAMIGVGRFVLGSEVLAVPVWWSYAAQILITAGFFFGRVSGASATPGG